MSKRKFYFETEGVLSKFTIQDVDPFSCTMVALPPVWEMHHVKYFLLYRVISIYIRVWV